MHVRIASGSARPGARTLASVMTTASALTTTVVAFVVGSLALAQVPPAPQQKAAPVRPPAASPAAPPAPKGAAAPIQQKPGAADTAQQQPQLIFSPWEKFCRSADETNGQPFCATAKDGRFESGMLAVSAALIEFEGEATKILRVTLPLGLLVRPGTRVIIDQGQPMAGQYAVCLINGCVAEYEASAELINQLKRGQGMFVQGVRRDPDGEHTVSMGIPLTDFAKAYDGAPTDQKVFAEQQKKLQDDLQKRAEDARKKLEAQQPAPR